MADYPQQPHYGASYGHANNPYQPPLYPNQYVQPNDSHTADNQYMSNYNQNMGAYGYNAAVPGFNAAALASAPSPLPIYQGWNQDPTPLPAYTTPQNSMPNNGYSAPSYNNYIPPYPPVPQPAYQQNSQPAKAYDENDVNGGSYTNGYTAPAAPQQQTQYNAKASTFQSNDGNGYTDTAHRAVYAGNQDAAPPQNSRPDSRNTRQTSGSHSPYDDRASIQPYIAHALGQAAKNGQKNKQSWTQKPTVNPPRPASSQATKPQSQPPARVATPIQPVQPVQPVHPVNGTAYKSVAEARKKGQGAVLNLYPLDVRYQQYVEEGFDEVVVGRLFDDLGLSREASNKKENTFPAKVEDKDTQDANRTPKAATVPEGKKDNRPVSPRGVPVGGSTVASAPVKAAPATDKERTLQMKMEALRKSREERAKNAAAKNAPKFIGPPLALPPASAPTPIIQSEAAIPEPAVIAPTEAASSTIQESHLPTQVPVATAVPLPPVQAQDEVSTPVSNFPAPSIMSQSAPAIPGLFMGSSGQRKRPVAADFDTALTITPYKRPFGQSRSSNTSVVIHVSEDEGDSDDEDVEMDLESMADQDSPKQPPTRKMSEQRNNALQNLPQLSNFQARKPYTTTRTSSPASTPPSFQPLRKPTLPKPDGLREKEIAIEDMRRRIAEAEARKKAQQASNGSRTPRSSSGIAEKPATHEITAAKVEAAVKIQQLIEVAENKVSFDKQRLEDIQAVEVQNLADLKRDEAESRRLRRQKIATDLPRVDAEVEEKQRKLEQLRAQMAEMEAEVQKTLSDKQKLAEEMELLGQEAEDQLEVRKQSPGYMTPATNEPATHRPTPTDENTVSPPFGLPVLDAESAPSASLSARDLTPSRPPAHEPDKQVDIQVDHNSSLPVLTTNTVDISGLSSGSPQVDEPTQLAIEKIPETVAADHILEAALQESARAEAESTAPSDGDDIDTEDFYAPDPNQLAPVLNDSRLESNRSPSYSPGLDDNIDTPNDERDSVGDYEPPEAASPVGNSPPFSPDPPPKPLESQRDQEIFAESETSLAIDEGEVSEAESAMDYGRSSVPNTDLDNSLPQRNGSVPPMIQDLIVDHPEQPQRFTRYESPLRYFHAFRFHPEYNKQVPGGLRSLTYSHKIDAMKQFCPWELGGSCNDRDCTFQHFRDIGLLDDGIVSALGNPAEFTGDQRVQFCNGLRAILTEIRTRKIRDFDVIAQEVIAHRADFLNDPSKILILD